MDDGEVAPQSRSGSANQPIFTPLNADSSSRKLDGEGDTRDSESDQKQIEVHFKALHGIVVAFFTLVLILHALGIYLFTSGFLLTRLVLDSKSSCSIPPIDLYEHSLAGYTDAGCWHPRTFDKAVIIIVDALRYDFAIPYDRQGLEQGRHHYHDSIPILYETATHQPQNAFLRPFIADPPTATLQRLKGLTTGTLPTFVDLGTNFAGTAIDEDNIVAQLRNASKRVVHLGDDTWHALFPDYFDPKLTRPYDSFNVWDLHTVDNGVTEHLIPLLSPQNVSKWDVIFGHYLGVDHAGHRYGPDHPAMTAKLNQMNDLFRTVIEAIDDDTLLVVMGDHGMDSKGDHGGESDDEIQAALWMYSKRPTFGRTNPSFIDPPAHAKERPVAQIDLVPTLSLLLGLPIPFNNLGAPIEEAFIGKEGEDIRNLALVNRLTSAQIHRYQREYAHARNIDATAQSPTLALWNTAVEAFDLLRGSRNPTTEQWWTVFQEFSKYQQSNLSACRSLWARFDLLNMGMGIAVLFGSLAILVTYAQSLQADRAEASPLLFVRGLIGLAVGAAGGFGFGSTFLVDRIVSTSAFGASITSVIGIASGFWSIGGSLYSILPKDIWGSLSLIFTLLPCIGFASNSYTIWEDEILLFFLSTFGIIMLASSFRIQVPAIRLRGCIHSSLFIVLTRIASLSRLCREEQMPFCKSTYYASATSSTSAPWQLLIPFSVAICLPEVLKYIYKDTESYEEPAPLWIGFSYRMGLLFVAIFWTLDAADDGDWLDVDNETLKSYHGTGVLKTSRIIIARVVLALAFIGGYAVYYLAKPMLRITANPKAANGDLSAQSPSSKAPAAAGKSSITVHGYANVHGTRYALLPIAWSLAAILLSKPMGTGALGICVWQIFSLFEMLSANNLTSSPIGPVILALLGSFHFFKTGHQAALSSIQWESAFVPLRTIQYPWSPLLVTLNTFGAQILCAVAVPAVVLWKQTPKRKGGYLGDVAGAAATHVAFYAAVNLATTMWAGHLRRHLMLYRIFCPRFMTGAVVLLIVDVMAAFVALAGLRWNVLSVAEVFGWS
ncbi:MAG: mannose-ethanolamine phosphotransferase gpi13 [Bogoriella megaspora]|nr:MAG: mannose-ethanolamine phosphotransferase gpi13 [Bogoriella megaspora]